jgi:hypothetical protein
MSNALAIASVTAVLKDLLNNSLIDHDLGSSVGEVIVSALPPDRIDALDSEKKSRLNLFMYQVVQNAGWRNVGLPSHNDRAERISNPPLALDLHYLLTAYGAEEFHAEILLGYGMQLFHETPVLPRAAIRRSLAPPSPVSTGGGLPPSLQALSTSNLAEQVEMIKIAPQSITTEEISRMWTAFQAKYRPTAVYQATVVLIESQRSTRSALPVRQRNVHVETFRQPFIDRLLSQKDPASPILADQPILAGYNLVIAGRQLRGDVTSVNIGGIAVTPSNPTDTMIIAGIPDGLQAGVQGVQVVQQVLMGSPPVPHAGVESNLSAFVLRPQIVGPVGISNLQGSGSDPRSADVTLQVNPAIGDAQRVVLLLNQFVSPLSPPSSTAPPQAYSFNALPRVLVSPPGPPGSSHSVTIPISGVQAGTYLARVQVDGAESPLDADATGLFVAPQVNIP